MNFKPKFERKGQSEGHFSDTSNFESITKYMATDLVTFKPDNEIREVIAILLDRNISGAPVLNEQHEIIGLIDDKDCLRLLIDSVYHNQPITKATVDAYMTTVMKTISVHANVVDVANEFLNSKYKRLLVVDDKGKLVGQISPKDILRAIKTMNVPNWKKESIL